MVTVPLPVLPCFSETLVPRLDCKRRSTSVRFALSACLLFRRRFLPRIFFCQHFRRTDAQIEQDDLTSTIHPVLLQVISALRVRDLR